VYNAIIQPYLSYCCEVCNVFGETQSIRLQKLHNRAARVIAHVPNEVDQQTVLNILGWEPLKQQRVKAKANLCLKRSITWDQIRLNNYLLSKRKY
jgi:hypothetical protein